MNEKRKKEITSNNVAPKYVPIKCPVCEGWGSFSHGKVPCKSCEGKGYILVEAQKVKKEEKNGL
jgi:DnaJ-class molecular chaperone